MDILNVSQSRLIYNNVLGEIYRNVHHGDFLSIRNGLFISIYGETVTTAFNVFF